MTDRTNNTTLTNSHSPAEGQKSQKGASGRFFPFLSGKLKDIGIWGYIVFAAVTVVNFYMVLHHEPWRDEAQAWLIARDTGPLSIFNVLSYEGHPVLWYYVLMPFAKLHLPYLTLNIISFLVIEAALLVFLAFSPFSKVTNTIVALSPIFIYYLAAISRSYCLCALFVILIAAVYRNRQRHPILYCVFLALLLQTHIQVAGFAFILAFFFFAETVVMKKNGGEKRAFLSNIKGLLIVFLSGCLLIFEFRSVFGAQAFGGPVSRLRYAGAGKIVALAMAALAGLAILFAVAVFFAKIKTEIPAAVAAYLVGFGFRMGIYFFVYKAVGSRWTTSLCMFLFMLWVIVEELKENDAKVHRILTAGVNAVAVLTLVLFTLFQREIVRYSLLQFDIDGIYSGSKNTASYINHIRNEDDAIVANTEDFVNAIVPYLKDRTMYNPFNKAPSTYVLRDADGVHRLTYDEFLDVCRELFPDKDEVYVVCSKAENHIDGLYDHTDEFEVVYETVGNVMFENFIIYQIRL